jgi:nitrogen regulatory protein P-II 1
MKRIEAIIRPEKLDEVRGALAKATKSGLMITEIVGHGQQKGIMQQWRGEKFSVELLPKVKIEVVVRDADVEAVIKTIVTAARTGEIGDGKIFVSDVTQVVRIRTDERGEIAL